ncbi:MAG: hypothetical protein DRG31_06285 [Deltaproteobacteria bacterium]|nr:MAG: hypothetical protein DRG31_06285 [Deltaproteobacteria bacterium]
MFCHLHVRSGFTFLFGTFTPERLVERVRDLGMRAVALTDRGGLYGAVKFTRLTDHARIKPILGIKAQLSDGSILVLLARTGEAFGEDLYTRSRTTGLRGDRRVVQELLSLSGRLGHIEDAARKVRRIVKKMHTEGETIPNIQNMLKEDLLD